VLIHNPDAVGMWLYQSYPDAFEPVLRHTQLTVPLRSVLPSVTPVCFGTMYTGAAPAVHGIQAYEKPVITIDTFFDAVVRAGKKVALLCTDSCSLAKIFQGHGIDYYFYDNEGAILEKAQDLILADEYDVICVYTFMFDTRNHGQGPEARDTLNALYRQGQFFDMLVSSVKRNWKQHNTLVAFSPDHGVHKVEPFGSELNSKGKPVRGHHGSDRTEDLNILHYMGVVRRSEGKK
jgi:predicted AlkP superfamily pyrophosphatase or phosphodiesterase